ncbi:CRISPR-associated endonuclease Cas3'' [Streptomyces cacaoi]|uniref:CRISPR-associated endonuclease Cas3'' n=1 Tax=Streptomyces cacaoi TaxID=1898 RepID=UPI00374A6BAD
MGVNPLIWGKTRGLGRPHPLICHLLDTAALAALVWDRLLCPAQRRLVLDAVGLSESETRGLVAFWAGLHDIAKITVPFQFYKEPKDGKESYVSPGLFLDKALGDNRPAAFEKELGHETAALWTLPELLEDAGYPRRPGPPYLAYSHVVGQILAGHGGLFPAPLAPGDYENFPKLRRKKPELGKRAWADERRAHFNEVRRVLGADVVPTGTMTAQAAVILTGITMLADQLASEETHLNTRLVWESWTGHEGETSAYWPVAQSAAEELLDWARFTGTSFSPPLACGPEAQQHIGEELPGLISQHGPGLVVVAGEPGTSRTEAALYAASLLGHAAGSQGIFYALPSGTAADGRLHTVRSFAERALQGPRHTLLLHNSSRLAPWEATEQVGRIEPEFSSEERWAPEARSWLAEHKRSLLAAVGTGTVDELLQAVLPLPHNAMRLFALSRKVVVVDEAHARGPWGHKLMSRFLEWMGALGTPVVLATSAPGQALDALPRAYRQGAGEGRDSASPAVPMPGCAYVSAGTIAATDLECPQEITLDVETRAGAEDVETAAAVELFAASGNGRVVVFRPTPEAAVATFRHLAAAFPVMQDGQLLLVHEQMPNRDRWKATAEAKHRLAPGPDEHALTVLVTTPIMEHAPEFSADLVISGPAPLGALLARAPRKTDGARLLILSDGATAAADDRSLLCRTREVLGAGRRISIPGDLRTLYDEVYADDLVTGLEDAAARELRELDNRRAARGTNDRGTAGWAAVPPAAEVGSNLHLLSKGPEGMDKSLLSPALGDDLVEAVCLFRKKDDKDNKDNQKDDKVNKDNQKFFFDPGATEEAKTIRGKKNKKGKAKVRWDPVSVVPHLITVPRGCTRDVNCWVNNKWEQTGSLKTVVPIVMHVEDGNGVYESPHYRFELTPHGLLIQQLAQHDPERHSTGQRR